VMKTIIVTFKTDVPVDDVTDYQVREWIEYLVGDRGGCSMKNPLVEYGLEARDVEIDD